MVTLILFLQVHASEPVLIEAPKVPAPVCVEYCNAQ